ncbi:MAG: two component transcriptional regulator, winged helix family [Hyphomicrobiales bacterium]|jgi:two-component system phosphate regulon response regulator OmpR|nr:two component transcriptional regulator, winged helix family [Hyphomicrobiales bacterium]
MNEAAPSTTPAMALADDAPHLLVVDDDRRIRALISRYLTGQGYRVTTAGAAAEARARLRSMHFDLIILDVMMPGETGLEFAERFREDSDVPILMLTARTETADRVRGLEVGADDYLAKPFEPKELSLRIASILRRTAARMEVPVIATVPSVRFGVFTFNLERGELRQADENIRLTDRERFMLRLLANAAGEPVSRETLAGEGGANNERTVDVQINRLRRKIEIDPTNPHHLQTARGAGYRLMLDR